MRRFYKESWLGVPFPSFTHVSFFRLANSEFYASFYEELFRHFDSWESLPTRWRKHKDMDVEWLLKQIFEIQKNFQFHEADIVEEQEVLQSIPSAEETVTRVLTVGLGPGYFENVLVAKIPDLELHVNSPNTAGLRWLREIIPPEHIYIGSPANCLPSNVQYHVICLTTVDYTFTNEELALALRELKAQLIPGGKILCISSSLLEEHSALGSLVNVFKIGLRALLHFLGLRRQQFWGWRRTRAEYHRIFESAGFTCIQDGWLQEGFSHYWISGE